MLILEALILYSLASSGMAMLWHFCLSPWGIFNRLGFWMCRRALIGFDGDLLARIKHENTTFVDENGHDFNAKDMIIDPLTKKTPETSEKPRTKKQKHTYRVAVWKAVDFPSIYSMFGLCPACFSFWTSLGFGLYAITFYAPTSAIFGIIGASFIITKIITHVTT